MFNGDVRAASARAMISGAEDGRRLRWRLDNPIGILLFIKQNRDPSTPQRCDIAEDRPATDVEFLRELNGIPGLAGLQIQQQSNDALS
jgi:hypothetical protein